MERARINTKTTTSKKKQYRRAIIINIHVYLNKLGRSGSEKEVEEGNSRHNNNNNKRSKEANKQKQNTWKILNIIINAVESLPKTINL